MITIGIDIGDFSVKLAEISSNAKTYSLERVQEFFLSSDPTKDKKIEILDILRQISAAYDPKLTRFVMAVRQEHVALRYRNFPFKERHKILKSIAFELEDDIPFSQEDAVFDAKITRYVENSADVLAGACPKVYLLELIQLARESGIEPEIITVEGLALSNLLVRWFEPPPTLTALAPTPEPRPAEFLLDIGHHRSLMIMHSEGALIGARNIDWGGKQIADAIASKYGIHYLEALKELQKKGFLLINNEGATKEQTLFSDTIKAAFDTLAQEIRFTLLEVSQARNLQFKSAQLSGGVSQIKNLGPFLTQKLEVACNRLQHFSLHPQVNFEASDKIEAVSATAVGIAIESLRRPRNPAVNLLKGEFAQQSEAFKIFWEKWNYTAKLLLSCFFILLLYGFLRETFAINMNELVSDALKSQAAAVADLKGRQASPNNIRRFVKQKKDEISARKQAGKVKEINSVLDIIADVHRRVPGAKQLLVEIRKLTIENEVMEIHGEVASADAVGKFRKSLEGVASDGRVEPISAVITPAPDKQAFAFRLRVQRKKGG